MAGSPKFANEGAAPRQEVPRANAPGAASGGGASDVHGVVRGVLVAGYLGMIALLVASPTGTRLFWTIGLPLLPLFIVLGGFHLWRRICPLAFFQLLGRRIPRATQRRAGEFLDKNSYLVSLSILAASLALRLLLVNGDGPALALLLVGLAVAAFSVGALYTGKTWCNFFCPVSIVERIYTEPASLQQRAGVPRKGGGPGAPTNSQCPKCTACKKNCPDIEQEAGYWKELDRPSRRTAYYLYPGLVLSFYLAYALPRGTLTDYFDGSWLRQPEQWRSVLAPGLWFLPSLPKLVVMPLALALGMALSYGALSLVEGRLAKRSGFDAQRARHVTLSIAAVAAFNFFYLFAGQPSLRRVPGLSTVWPLVVVTVATLILVKRYRRREGDWVEEKTVRKLLAKWTYDEPPPADPKEVLAFVKVHSKQREQVLTIYADAVREALADGVVVEHEHQLLERLRAQLGVSQAEHDKLLACSAHSPANGTGW